MNSISDIAKSLKDLMENSQRDLLPTDAERNRRLAVMTYAEALKAAPTRSREINEICLEEAHVYAQKAISLGVSEENIEKSFSQLRQYWLPRLKEVSDVS